jgi:lysophospholipase L1-like esterase
VAARLKSQLVNLACPGESSVTLAVGNCPYVLAGQQLHERYAGTQLAAALRFLLTHRGRAGVVTLTIWGNDINAFVADCHGDLDCIQTGASAEIAKFSARLTAILAALRLAAGPRTTFVLTGPYDPNPTPIARSLFVALEQAMRHVTAHTGTRFAPLLTTFEAVLCSLTLLCSDGDAHPSDAGYAAIATQILEAIR